MKNKGSKHTERKHRKHETWFQEHGDMDMPYHITTHFFMKEGHIHLSDNKTQDNLLPTPKKVNVRCKSI